MKPILAARFTAQGKHPGMHYLRREFGRGVHNWLVKFDIVDPQTGVEGVDDRMQDEIRVRGGSFSLVKGRIANSFQPSKIERQIFTVQSSFRYTLAAALFLRVYSRLPRVFLSPCTSPVSLAH